MGTLDVIFGDSCYLTMKNSQLGDNTILMINALLNIGDLSNIEDYKIKIPKKLCMDTKNNYIEEETNIIISNINKKNKIRVWAGHNDIYSYLILLYVSSIIKKYDYDLFALYCDDYDKNCISPSMMNEEELESLVKLEHKLSKDEINNNANRWNKLVSDNTELRIIENGTIKSVSLNYYDKYILGTLKSMGKVRIAQLVGKLMGEIYLQDIMYVYLIERLINDNKIKIELDENAGHFEILIETMDV